MATLYLFWTQIHKGAVIRAISQGHEVMTLMLALKKAHWWHWYIVADSFCGCRWWSVYDAWTDNRGYEYSINDRSI